ncbi:hypothetical protein D3C79_145520 [compost metagenome]
MDAAALAGDFRTGNIHDAFLRVVHHGHARRNALADHRSCGQRAVGVKGLDPVVVLDAQILGVVFTHPDNRPAARQGQHQQVVAVGGVNAPFLVRRQEIQRLLFVAVRLPVQQRLRGAGVDRRAIHQQAFAKGAHPFVILIQLLATAEGAPRDQLMHVGVTGVIRHMLIFQP